ncbi:MAG: ribonuclease H-like domain-containing protein [Calditrichia bacterium]
MRLDHLALDIETVPARALTYYSPAVQEKLLEKIGRRQDRDPEFDYDYFASIHGDFGKIICISVAYISPEETIRLKSFYGDEERDILLEFNELVKNHRGVFIHYNGLSFDIPFILQRMAHHSIPPSSKRFCDLRRFSSDPHFDVMMHYYNWDMQKVLPLGILAELHGMPSPKDELSGGQVLEAYNKGRWEQIKRYCEFDTATTVNLWRKLFLYQPAIPFEKYQFSG